MTTERFGACLKTEYFQNGWRFKSTFSSSARMGNKVRECIEMHYITDRITIFLK